MSVSNKSDQNAMEDENNVESQNVEDNSQNNANNNNDQQDQNEGEGQENQQKNDQVEGDDENKNQVANENENDEEYEEIKYDKNEIEDENKENENNQNDLADYNEDDEEDDEVGQKRRRKEKKLKKKKQQNEEEDQQTAPETLHPITQKIRQITYQVKKRKNLTNSNLVTEYAELIQKEMEELYQKDIECNKKSQPAINKLTGIDQIAQKLKHKNIQGEFLMNGGLEKFVKWLSKMPDGSSPSQPLKKKILQLIQKFTIDRETIIKSSIGKIIMGFNKSTTEPIEIRQMAKSIVNNWSRIISENVIDYHQQNDYDDDYDKDELDQIKKKLQINRQSSNQDIDLLNNKKVSKFVELPDTKNYAFYFNPKPMDDDDDNEVNVQDVSEKTKEAFKNLADLTRKKTR